MKMKTYKTIDLYIQSFPKDVSDKLKTFKTLTKKIAPTAVESISYGMPAYKLDGKVFVYFAGFKNHVSLFPFPSTVSKFKKEVSRYTTSKGTIQFPLNEKLPVSLITKIIKFRLHEVKEKMKK